MTTDERAKLMAEFLAKGRTIQKLPPATTLEGIAALKAQAAHAYASAAAEIRAEARAEGGSQSSLYGDF